MSTSRAVLLLGMHRSGTSAVARGLAALGVYLGNDFLDAQPENPTGYWEDRNIVELDDRVLQALGLKWDDTAPIAPARLERRRIRKLRREAVAYVERTFAPRPVWGFKDPRAIRILPFWSAALAAGRADDSYVVAIRNPLSVAASLYERQAMDREASLHLWLVHMLPFLHLLAGKAFVVVDYDLLMRDPRGQLARIAKALDIGGTGTSVDAERFASDFLDAGLRHSHFTLDDLDGETATAHVTGEAYRLLYEMACDRLAADRAFWERWAGLQGRLEGLLAATDRAAPPGKGWFLGGKKLI